MQCPHENPATVADLQRNQTLGTSVCPPCSLGHRFLSLPATAALHKLRRTRIPKPEKIGAFSQEGHMETDNQKDPVLDIKQMTERSSHSL